MKNVLTGFGIFGIVFGFVFLLVGGLIGFPLLEAWLLDMWYSNVFEGQDIGPTISFWQMVGLTLIVNFAIFRRNATRLVFKKDDKA